MTSCHEFLQVLKHDSVETVAKKGEESNIPDQIISPVLTVHQPIRDLQCGFKCSSPPTSGVDRGGVSAGGYKVNADQVVLITDFN